MTDTPRVDASEKTHVFSDIGYPDVLTKYVDADFARQLERELAEAKRNVYLSDHTAKVESLTPITHRPCGACNASVGPSEWEWLVTDSQTPLPASETPDSAAGTAHP